jgi:23S rRNA (pseudouridine1915-N3)-methyltransferase
MRLHILAFGHSTVDWAEAGINDYHKRFPKEWPLTIELLKPEKRHTGKPISGLLQIEASRLTQRMPKQSKVMICDERGKGMKTVDFARSLQASALENASLCFCMGSADGFDAEFKSRHELISLSPMTMPHELARLLLVEQLYRAVCILNNHPYHRE